MSTPNEMAPEAAATASRAQDVAIGKSTAPNNSKRSLDASRFGSLRCENGGEQTRRPSLREAVNAMCKSCIYDPGSGDGAWRQQVQACSSSNCALHSVRPVPVTARKAAHIASPVRAGNLTAAGVGSALPVSEMGLNDDISDERRAA